MDGRVTFVKNSEWEVHHTSFSGYSRLMKFVPAPRGAVDGTTWSDSRIGYVLRSVNGLVRMWPQHFRFELSEAELSRKTKGIVHHLYGETTCFLSPFFAAGRTVATFHLPPGDLQHIQSRLWKLPAKWLAAAIALSNRQAAFLRETLGIRVEFIPHGVDVQAVRERLPERPTDGTSRHCVFVGKYLRDFEALEWAVRGLEPGTTVSVLSSTMETARLRDRLQKDPTKAKIVFHDRVSDAEFLNLLGNADVFLLALRDGTANNALLEAMAAGLAVVSFGSYHPDDYLPREARCFNRDGVQAANEVEDLFCNSRRLAEMQASSRSRAESLDWSRVVPQLLQLYDSIGP